MNTKEQPTEQPVTWWNVSRWSTEIAPVQVYKVTPQFLYVRAWPSTTSLKLSRTSKDNHYETFEAAKQAKIDWLRARIVVEKRALKSLERDLAHVQSMKEPA